MPLTRVEVTPRQGEGMRDVRGDVVRRQLMADHGIEVKDVRTVCGYLIDADTPSDAIAARVDDVFADPIIEHGATNELMLSSPFFTNIPEGVVSVGFKPGVTDNPGKAATDGFLTLFPDDRNARIATYVTYAFYGLPNGCDLQWLAGTLHNGLIERVVVATAEQCAARAWPQLDYPTPPEQ